MEGNKRGQLGFDERRMVTRDSLAIFSLISDLV